jgi:hypothetical protein
VEPTDLVTVRRLEHPDAVIRQLGFPLDHPYVEVVWGSGVGPSVVHMLRQLPRLWAGGDSVRMEAGELGLGLGFPGRRGLRNTLKRAVDFGLGERQSETEVGIYAEVRFLPRRLLRAAPAWVVSVHEEHVVAAAQRVGLAGGDRPELVAAVRARLDRFEQPTAPRPPAPPGLAR